MNPMETEELCAELEAENARLRKALEGVMPYAEHGTAWIVGICQCKKECETCKEARSAIDAAREAMKL